MCGGVRFTYNERQAPLLSEAYAAADVEKARESGVVESVFWQARPVLPALIDDEGRLFDWGNRDSGLKLPKTGWVRIESLADGKWNYLKPREVLIPVFQGYEKKVWFTIDHGIRGLLECVLGWRSGRRIRVGHLTSRQIYCQPGRRSRGRMRSSTGRCDSSHGGRRSFEPSSAGASSAVNPGGSVAISKSTPPGSRK